MDIELIRMEFASGADRDVTFFEKLKEKILKSKRKLFITEIHKTIESMEDHENLIHIVLFLYHYQFFQ